MENIGRKIIILGCSGSGKSTLARKLGDKTGLPLVHLDNVWWRPDRTHVTREAFDARLAEILSRPQWILDGDYSRTYAARFAACDTVIFLDFEEQTCMRGIEARVGQSRPDIPWTEDRLDPELVAMVRRYRADNRPRILELISQYPGKRVRIFTTRAQADAWISNL